MPTGRARPAELGSAVPPGFGLLNSWRIENRFDPGELRRLPRRIRGQYLDFDDVRNRREFDRSPIRFAARALTRQAMRSQIEPVRPRNVEAERLV